jgi:hypothetical protein
LTLPVRSQWLWPPLLALIVVSLLANGYLIWRMAALQQQIETAVGLAEEARDDVARQRRETEQVQRQIDALSNAAGLALENVEAQLGVLETQLFTMTIPIDEQIPINISFPFEETFDIPINTVVPINTTVRVPVTLGPLGRFDLDVPIRTEVPISLNVQVPIKKDIPINTTVPLQMQIPVTLSLEGTPLGQQLAEWRTLLSSLRELGK